MPHVKFDGSGFIAFRHFAFFVVDFFTLRTENLDQIIICIILHCLWVWYNIFLVTIISSEDLIPQCDFKLSEICDDVETCMGYGQDTFLLHSPQ